MSILIINRFTHDLCPYEQWLQNLDEELILLTSVEVSGSFHANDYAYTESFPQFDRNGCVELRAIELFSKYHFHTIIAIHERDILRASYLRERFDLEGQRPNSAQHFRDKTLMKQIAHQYKIPAPSFSPLNSTLNLISFVEKHGYPVVVKPIDGSGSRNILIINDQFDLVSLLQQGIPSLAEVETFVSGEMYHVDGLVTEGEVVFVSASKYASGCLAFQSGGYNASFLINRTNPLFERLTAFTIRLLHVLDTPLHTTFHAELFHTSDDQIYLCEIASRTGGGRLAICIEQAYGIHLNRAWIEAQCGISPVQVTEGILQRIPDKLTGDILIPPRHGQFISGPTQAPPSWVTEYRILAQSGHHYDHPKISVDHIASFVVEGKTEQEVEERLFAVANWFDQLSVWN